MTRLILAVLLAALLTGCGAPGPAPRIDLIELRQSGWEALDVVVARNGRGRFHRSHPLPRGRGGSFAIAPRQFEQLLERLAPFQREAVPVTAESVARFIDARCPEGVHRATDMAAIYLRWVGRGVDRHYLADLGCDPERHTARNGALRAIIASLPLPPEEQGADRPQP
jgi:hypothetical protein